MFLNSLKKSVISAFYSIKAVSSLESPYKYDSCLASFCAVFLCHRCGFFMGAVVEIVIKVSVASGLRLVDRGVCL